MENSRKHTIGFKIVDLIPTLKKGFSIKNLVLEVEILAYTR